MKVTPELIEKYLLKDCSEQEIKIVEQWMSSNEQEQSTISNSNLEKMESEIWNSLYKNQLQNTTKVITLYKKVMRNAAVACVVIGVFFAGRYSKTDNENIVAQKVTTEQTNNLFVYGGNGTHAKAPGNEFNLKFNGQLKLYNASTNTKIITVGDTHYTLKPKKTYFLIGDNQKSSLIAGLDFEINEVGLSQLKGDFDIKILRA